MSVKMWVLKECAWLEADNSENFCIPVTYGHNTQNVMSLGDWEESGYVMEHVDSHEVVLFAVQTL